MNLKTSTTLSTQARALIERSQSAHGSLNVYMGWCDDLADKDVGGALFAHALSIKQKLHFAQAILNREMRNKTVSKEACDEFAEALKEALTQASGLQGFGELLG